MDSSNPASEDYTGTNVISERFVLEGVVFSWWSVGEAPAHVTVSNALFGNKSGVANGDKEAFAKALAKDVLLSHQSPRFTLNRT